MFKSDKQGVGYYRDALSADIWQPFDAAGDVAASAGASAYCLFKSMRLVCPQTGTDTASLSACVACVLKRARPTAYLRACVSYVPKSALTRLVARCSLLHCSAAAAVLPSCLFKRMCRICASIGTDAARGAAMQTRRCALNKSWITLRWWAPLGRYYISICVSIFFF